MLMAPQTYIIILLLASCFYVAAALHFAVDAVAIPEEIETMIAFTPIDMRRERMRLLAEAKDKKKITEIRGGLPRSEGKLRHIRLRC